MIMITFFTLGLQHNNHTIVLLVGLFRPTTYCRNG